MADDNKKIIEQLRELNRLLEQEKQLSIAVTDYDTARARQSEINTNNQKLINELKTKGNDLSDEEEKILKELEKTQQNINVELTKEQKTRRALLGVLGYFNNQLKIGWQYLMQSDKIIKSTILSLGMSGTKAELMRTSFEQSAGFVARLGGSLEDIGTIMGGYADETGRARVLSADMVKDITAIGKGTGLGIEQATKLGAQFELMGFDAKATMNYVQGVVDTSERMGVNTTKVLKNVNDNFKRLNTYTFQQGVKGFAQMAMYAEKFRIDISQALNAADIAKTLEGAIDLAANLQIMGGEFAKTDPFQMLFLSRNDPAKFTEKIADMTKGVVSFRKVTDSAGKTVFEKFISPADRDRIAAVAKSLGMETGALTEMAERQAEIQRMRQQMGGMGLSDKEKELIEGAAIFNKETGRFEVQLAGQMKDITSLTKTQANAFTKEHILLEERAKSAQTFDEAFKATIAELKTALLPILKSVNSVLVWARPYIIKFTEAITKGPAGWIKVIALFIGAGVMWKTITLGLQKVVGGLIGSLPSILGRGKGITTLKKTAESGSGLFEQRKGIGAGALAKGKGMKALGTGAGIGAAMAGTGAGIMFAAQGISKLADSMAKLTPEQAKSLASIAKTLAITFPLAAIGLAAVGTASAGAAIPILAVGAAIVGIGFGIRLATVGIGKMAEGIGKMNESGTGAGKQLLGVAAGVGAITLAMGAGGIVSMFAFNNSLARMTKHSEGIEKIGLAFNNIKTVLSGSKNDFIAVENAIASISNMNIKGGSMLSDLANLMKTPLKVEFADKRLAVVNDITLNIDGQKFMQKTYNVNAAIQKTERARTGQAV